MNNTIKSSMIVVASLLVGAAISYFIFGRSAEVVEKVDAREEKQVSVVKTSRKNNIRKVTEVSLVNNNGNRAVRIVESEMPRPGVVASVATDEIDEEDLTVEQKQILADLQEALDNNNLRQVRKVLTRFAARVEDGGLAGNVPVCMRMKAVEALGWFGKDAAADLIVFVADANEDVSSDAFSQFEMALNDCALGDVGRAQIVKSMMKALNDTEKIDTLLTQLEDMRNSVKVETISDILANGTENAREIMLEQLSDYTDSEVTTQDDLMKWAAENPDDEGDAELYGGAASE